MSIRPGVLRALRKFHGLATGVVAADGQHWPGWCIVNDNKCIRLYGGWLVNSARPEPGASPANVQTPARRGLAALSLDPIARIPRVLDHPRFLPLSRFSTDRREAAVRAEGMRSRINSRRKRFP